MSFLTDQKVTANHLKRDAYLYVRQSTIRQVFENTESTKRQYGLRQKAIALGWPTERVMRNTWPQRPRPRTHRPP